MEAKHLEFLGEVHKQISEKIDLNKPFPQDVDVEIEMNLIIKNPRCSGVIDFNG